MTTDFMDAHERHWEDAEHLFGIGRLANADQLYGLSAECGLKRLMLRFGMAFDQGKERPSEFDDRCHANGVWSRFESYRSGHPEGTGYALSSHNPFSDWAVSQRYFHRSHIDRGRTRAHKEGALEVRNLVGKARREGLL